MNMGQLAYETAEDQHYTNPRTTHCLKQGPVINVQVKNRFFTRPRLQESLTQPFFPFV